MKLKRPDPDDITELTDTALKVLLTLIAAISMLFVIKIAWKIAEILH